MAGAGLLGGSVALAGGNAAPTAVTVVVSPTVVVEGDTVSLTVQLNSAATDQLGVQVTWGDGSLIDSAFINPGQTQVSPAFSHRYLDDVPSGTPQDLLTISVRVENAFTSLSGSATVLVKNSPPTMTSLTVSPSTIAAGEIATVTGVFADLGIKDRHSVMVEWGDGDTTMYPRLDLSVYTFSYTHKYLTGSPYPYTITAWVTDWDTGSVAASVPLTVLSANQAPSNLLLAMSAVAEGGTSTLTASFVDPDPADTHSVTVNWGDGSAIDTLPTLAAGVKTFSPTHTFVATGTYTVTVVLNDSAGHSIKGTTPIVVSNVAPSVTLGAVSSPVEGDNFVLSGTFSDPGTTDTFTLSVDWGDATAKSAPTLGPDGRSFTASHTYTVARSTPYLAVVTVTDRDGASGTASASVLVGPRTATTSAELLDQMSALVRSFELNPMTERWFLNRINELKASLAHGSEKFCSALGDLDRISSVARNTLTSEQLAAFNELMARLQASATCSAGDETGQHGPLGTNPAATTPTLQKPAAPQVNADKHEQVKDYQGKKVSDKSEENGQNNSDRRNSRNGANH
jgi:hypothetical protein